MKCRLEPGEVRRFETGIYRRISSKNFNQREALICLGNFVASPGVGNNNVSMSLHNNFNFSFAAFLENVNNSNSFEAFFQVFFRLNFPLRTEGIYHLCAAAVAAKLISGDGER